MRPKGQGENRAKRKKNGATSCTNTMSKAREAEKIIHSTIFIISAF
jgi:hypothetical protein